MSEGDNHPACSPVLCCLHWTSEISRCRQPTFSFCSPAMQDRKSIVKSVKVWLKKNPTLCSPGYNWPFLTTFDFSSMFHLKNCSPCLVWCCFYQHNLTFLTGQLFFHSDILYNTYFPIGPKKITQKTQNPIGKKFDLKKKTCLTNHFYNLKCKYKLLYAKFVHTLLKFTNAYTTIYIERKQCSALENGPIQYNTNWIY